MTRPAAGSGFDVVCVGLATIDTVAAVPRLPAADERVTARSICRAGGGPSATAAVVLARLGARVAFVGCVGDDEAGRAIVEELRQEGVDVTGLVVAETLSTPQSCVLVDKESGARSIVTTGAAESFPEGVLSKAAGFAGPLAARAGWVHLDHVGHAIWRRVEKRAGSASLSVDGGNPIEDLSLRGVALYAPTLSQLLARHEQREGSGRAPSVEQACRAAHAEGAGTIVATDGAKGCVVSDESGLTAVPAVEVEVVSTLGAGDAFHAGLLFGLVEGRGAADAAAFASVVAAECCRALDGRSGVAWRRARPASSPD